VTRLTPHFDSSEFAQHDGVAAPAAYLAQMRRLCAEHLEPLRKKFGPVTITSGYRSASYNAGVGGAPQSFHRSIGGRAGAAADVHCRNGTPAQWYRFLDARGVDGLGQYASWVHVDNRGYRARW